MPNNLIRHPNFGALVVLVWLVVALTLLLQYWEQTAESLLDADDAMRLVQMRAWLAGQGWFDLHNARIEPPGGYDSHWSRLIDAGLAALLLLFQYFDPPSAERLMRAWWPLLWLLPTIAGMTAIAWRIAGREAAMVALLLALAGVGERSDAVLWTAMPAYQQFTPGRIDHHNVQIALALLVAAATVWSDRKRWTAAAAGALTGLAFAIGFESAPYLAICGGMLALRYVADADAGRALRDYGLALAASTALALLVSVGPDRWALNRCDAIAFNNAAAAISAGAVLALAAWLKHADGVTRLFAVAGAGCLGAAVLVLLEPRCARGPFAMVDPAIWPVWHDHVRAMQPLHAVFKVNPLTAAAAAAFPALALLAMAKLMTERKLRHDFGFLTASFVFLAAAAAMIAAVRGYSYAMWLGMPLVAGFTQRLFVAWQIERFIPRLATGLLFTPVAISAGAVTIAHANGLSDADSFARPASRHCLANASYAALARLAPGLVIADVGYGPYLLALTPHSVMGAPYHRLSTGIAVSRGVFASPPDDARAIVNAARLVGSGGQPTYLMICGPKAPDGLAEPGRGRSLWARLQAGSAPSWLEPVGEKGPLAVWRVKL